MDKGTSTVQRPMGSAASPRVAPIAVLLCSVAALSCGAGTAAAQTSVYRCTALDGSIEFRQWACDAQENATEIEIDDRRTGWIPPSDPSPSIPVRSKPTGSGSDNQRPGRGTAEATTSDAADKGADRCWAKRQQIERVNAELRAGYEPQQGVKLRRRRSEYEAFLNRYCR